MKRIILAVALALGITPMLAGCPKAPDSGTILDINHYPERWERECERPFGRGEPKCEPPEDAKHFPEKCTLKIRDGKDSERVEEVEIPCADRGKYKVGEMWYRHGSPSPTKS